MSALRPRSDVTWLIGTVVAAFIGSLVPLITNNRFYYYDDTQAGAFGIWFEIGTKLSAGEWPVFSDSAWGAGNYAAEGQWGIWNPLILLIGWLASRSANIVVFSTVLKIAFLCILAAGTFLLARSYKARPEWAAIAGVAVTLTGFTVYIDAASWVTGLMVFSLLPITWYGLRRMAFKEGNPLLALASAYVLITIGYVHGTLMLAIVFVGLLVEASLRGRRRASSRLLLAGLVCGFIALAVYLPGVLTAPVTARTGGIANSGFLTPDLSGLFTSWVPGTLPQVTGWWGGFATVPLLYVAWFLPVLSIVDYHRVKQAGRELSGLWFVGLMSLALTLAPSDLGPLRFPIRIMPYVSLAVLLTLSVLVSRFRVPVLSRGRVIVTAATVLAGLYLGWSQFPSFRMAAVFGLLAVAGIAGLLFFLYSPQRWPRLKEPVVLAGGVVLLSMAIAGGQHVAFKSSPLPDYRMPDTPGSYSSQLPEAQGGTFIVGDPTKLGPRIWEETLASNAWYLNSAEVQNLYTPIMFAKYAEDLCISSHGWTCPAAAGKLFETDTATGKVLADLLSIDTIQLLRDPEAPSGDRFGGAPPNGWHEADRSTDSVVWVRDKPLLNTGQPVWTSEGTAISLVSETSRDVRIRVDRMEDSPGKAVLSRLAWPGYKADGATVSAPLRGYLLAVDIPAGSVGKTLTISFEPPGWPVVVASIVLSVGVAGAWTVAELILSRRRRRSSEPVGGGGTAGSTEVSQDVGLSVKQ
ncbi:YfhO family protein [Arthrobacter sp. CDRTa11]|uniref:hypothetical protein n=1 Tax=Arthrobacter sp. CDRTa11 TaxID=2651199 RepID=UPI00226588C5|nr:hypothetical protein [Arthrobacter sp. CDRTa11]UZX03896.1 YfhO family protein [Arthrobacter sp. CDRTa11]